MLREPLARLNKTLWKGKRGRRRRRQVFFLFCAVGEQRERMAVATSAVRATVQALRQQGQLCAATGRATFRTSAVPRGGDHAPDYVHAKHMYDIKSVRRSFSLVCVCVCVCVRPGGEREGSGEGHASPGQGHSVAASHRACPRAILLVHHR